MSKVPLPPKAPPAWGKGKTVGRGRQGVRGGHGGGGGGCGTGVGVDVAEGTGVGVGTGSGGGHGGAPFVFRQTYDDDGNIVPLPLDTPLSSISAAEARRIRSFEKERDRQESDAAEALKERLHNPDGPSPLFIIDKPRKRREDDDLIQELPEGSKRSRKPAKSREMPLPVTKPSTKMTKTDMAAAAADKVLLKRLRASGTENEGPSRKKEDVNGSGGGLAAARHLNLTPKIIE
ncbi:hypothetical protein B0H17DRAFT_1214467 [Mycena rosella]|uniref:Uncharacterized protein n=1 Tax=Mycena rosella TaxID=1033263 RepID=A0AAD7CN09_MYCRO|nr:hypothetical protein B0H17DRAFT_1214467 [Mycena rosella]